MSVISLRPFVPEYVRMSTWPNTFKYMPKWRNFAKSGHNAPDRLILLVHVPRHGPPKRLILFTVT